MNKEDEGSLLGFKVGRHIVTTDTPESLDYANSNFICSMLKPRISDKSNEFENSENKQSYNCCTVLKTLKYAPKKIGGIFDCSYNKNLTSLEGCPQEGVTNFLCQKCNLTSLNGAPKKIGGDFSCHGNLKITSLAGIHKIIEEIGGCLNVPDCVESNILGVLKIRNLQRFNFLIASGYERRKMLISNIINKYLPNPSPSDIIDCQNELIDAGYEEYAEL